MTQLIARGPLNLVGGQVVNLKGYFRIISPVKDGKKDEGLVFMPHRAVNDKGVFTAPKVESDTRFLISATTEISGETADLEIVVRAPRLIWNGPSALFGPSLSVHAGEGEVDLGIRLENDPDGNEFNFSCEFISSPAVGKLLPKGKYLPPNFVPRTETVRIKARAGVGVDKMDIEVDLEPPICPRCKIFTIQEDGRCPSCGDTKYTVSKTAKCPRCFREKGWTGSRCILCGYPGEERKPV